jgi:hypothetical protein
MPKYNCWIEETVVHKFVVNCSTENDAENIIKEFVDNPILVPEIESYEHEELGSFGEDWVVDLVEEIDNA